MTQADLSRGAIRRFIALCFRRPWWVLLAFVVIGSAGGYLSSRLIFRGSFVELLPESAREVKDLGIVSEKAGGDGYLVVQVKGAPPETLQAYAHAVSPKLEALKEVRYVEYRYDIDFFKDRALLLLPVEKLRALHADLSARIQYEKQQANPLFVDLLDDPPPTLEEIEKRYSGDAPQGEFIRSQDGQELYLFIKPSGTAADLTFTHALLEKVTATLEAEEPAFAGVQTDTTGAYRIRIEEDLAMKSDLGFASLLSAVIAIGLILLGTRRASGLLVVGAPVMIGIAITFAVAQLTIGHLNVVTGFLVAILIGLGIEYGVHLAMRYWEERRLLPAEEAMAAAVAGTFKGALTSAGTNAAAFFVLLFAQFRAFAQFGFIAGVGILLTVLAAYAVGPAIVAVAERIRPMKPLPEERAAALRARAYRRWPSSVIGGMATGVLVFAAYSAYVAPQLGFESDLRKLKGASPATVLDEHVSKQIGVQITPAILLVDNLKHAGRVRQLIDQVKAKHGDQTSFHKSASLEDLVPTDVPGRLAELARLRGLLTDLPASIREGASGEKLAQFERLLDVQPWSAEEVPLTLRRRFLALDGEGTFVLLFPRYGNYDTEHLRLWADQIHEVLSLANAEGIEVHALDGNLIAARVFAMVKADGPYILWSAALVVFVMIVLSLRSVRKAVLVAAPLFLGMLCLAGGMKLFDVNLNFINAVVLPNLLAIAVDNSIHLFHRYEEEGPGSLGHVLRHTGWAAIVATLSNAAGYAALLTAGHGGLRSIGQLAVLGVFCTFMGTTVFFPALLALLERWRTRRGGLQPAHGGVGGTVRPFTGPQSGQPDGKPAPGDSVPAGKTGTDA